MSYFRKKPVVVEAVQLWWHTWSEMCAFAGVGSAEDDKPHGFTHPDGKQGLRIPTLEGTMEAIEGDWIIRGVKGELYPCKPDVFEATYEPVEDGYKPPDGPVVPID